MKPSLPVVAATAACALAALAAAPVSALGDPPVSEPLRVAEGEWDGTLTWSSLGYFPDAVAADAATGRLHFTVPDSGPVEGEFSVSGGGYGVTDVGEASLELTADGAVTGHSDDLYLDPWHANWSGTATVSGVTVPVNVEFGDQATDTDLLIESANRCHVSGSWGLEVPAAVQGAGGDATIEGNWAVSRYAPDRVGPEGEGPISDLLLDAQTVLSAANEGEIQAEPLLDVLRRATKLASELQTEASCGSENEYNLAVTGIVAKLLDAALANSDRLSAEELEAALRAGVAAGVFAGGVDPARAAELRKGFHDHFVLRLDHLLNSGEPVDVEVFDDEIDNIYFTALMMSWTDLARLAKPHLSQGPPEAPAGRS
jgi:hypothetical protein